MIAIDLPARHAASSSLPQQVPALRRFLVRAQRATGVREAVSVLLTTDARIRRLNRDFRNHDKSTDILSFPALLPPNSERHAIAGDLAISIDTAARQARQFRHSLNEELRILLLHGLLHLAGHDHESDHGEMAALEDRLRRRFRLPVALIGRIGRMEGRAPAQSSKQKAPSVPRVAGPRRKRVRR